MYVATIALITNLPSYLWYIPF